MDNSKTLRELIDEMKRIEQDIAEHKQRVKETIASNITEEVFSKLEKYDINAIDMISSRMFSDILRYAEEDKSDDVASIHTDKAEAAASAMNSDTSMMADGIAADTLDSLISVPEIKSV